MVAGDLLQQLPAALGVFVEVVEGRQVALVDAAGDSPLGLPAITVIQLVQNTEKKKLYLTY